MSKTKWYSKALYFAIALALAVSLAGVAATPQNVASAGLAKESEWTDVSTPSMEGWVIAPGSNIYDFDIAPDGKTIYAVGEVPGEPNKPNKPKLWKSEDGGVTWEDITENLTGEVTGAEPRLVAVAPDDGDIVVVAGMAANVPFVATSADGGGEFCDSGFAGVDEILCLDLSAKTKDEKYNIAVGTSGGEVWRFEICLTYRPAAWEPAGGYVDAAGNSVSPPGAVHAVYPGWDNSDAGGKNQAFNTTAVTSIAFSPNFDADDTILAVTVGDDGSTYLQTGLWGATEAWNAQTEIFPAAIEITPNAPDSIKIGCTGIALPEDYTGYDDNMRYSWVYVNYVTDAGPQGHVFEIDGFDAVAADIACGPNALAKDGYPLLASISMTGTIEGRKSALMVGAMTGECCEGVQVYRTGEWPIYTCCPDWQRADKPPTGLSNAIVAYTPDGKKAYVATSGDGTSVYDESAFSVSEIEEVGKYWNQLSLIDTYIDYLSDVAVNPACGTIYLASVNTEGCGCDSVWLSTDEGDTYMRIWCGNLEATTENGLLRFNPEETEKIYNVYLVDQGTNVVYWNEDGGLTYWSRRTASTLSNIVDFAVLDESTVYALSSDGKVARSDHNGSRWGRAVDAKVSPGHTIAVLGEYVLVGGAAGEASYSDNGGASFTKLDNVGDDNNVHVAFDSYFADNGVVYAAAGSIYRCEDLEEGEWVDLKAGHGPYCGIVLDNADGNPMTDADTGGVLYAVYDSGMARLLAAANNNEFDYLVVGAPGANAFIAEPSALRICGCLTKDSNTLLWAISMLDYDLEGGENNLFVYEDCLSKAAVELSRVKDGSTVPADPCECVNAEFALEWGNICNSSSYELEIYLVEDGEEYKVTLDKPIVLPAVDIGHEYLFIPKGTLECSRTYKWRVRVIEAGAEAIRSWWSPKWSFTVAAGPLGAIQLTAPVDGATDVAIEGVVFTWTSVAEATSYDFVLKDAAGFIVDSATIDAPGTSYAYAGTLGHDEAYTWQVTAMKDGSVLSESSVSTFRTVAAEVFTCLQCGLTFPTEAALKAHIAEAHAPVVPTTPAWVWVLIGIGAVLVIVVIVLIFRTRRV